MVEPGLTSYDLGDSKALEAAACLFRALRVYHQPQELMRMFDSLIPPSTLNALAELIAADPDVVRRGSSGSAGTSPDAAVDE